jgi:ribonuclease E
MVLESNRDLVLRRLTECLGRDRTKHQVAEVTSLGLVQMTRKRVGQGLLEVFSEPCEHCRGRGVLVHTDPVDERRRGGGSGNGPGASGAGNGGNRRDRSGGKDTAKETAKEEPVTVEADSGDDDVPEGGRSRRGRGRRNRGQSGEDRAAEDAAVLADSREASDDEAGEEPSEPAVSNAVEVVPVEEVPADDVAEHADDVPAPDGPAADEAVEVIPVDEESVPAGAGAGDGDGVVGRPRRRRAASRPAGPPVS